MFKRVLLIGSGSIGRRYLGILRERWPTAAVTLLRRPEGPPLDPAIAAEVGLVTDVLDRALEASPDFAIVASPAPTHIGHALALAEARVPMLIQKPLAADLDGCDELARRCSAGRVPVVVGYTLRHHPGFLALQADLRDGAIGRPLLLRAEVGQYLPDWRPGGDYRQTVTARRDLGGGALLELSHEIDLARALLGMPSSIWASLRRVGDLDIDVEDSADLVLHHGDIDDCRVVSSIHLDLLQRPIHRSLAVAGPGGRLELDLVTGQLRLRLPSGEVEERTAAPVGRDDLHAAEITDLVDAIGGAVPRVGLDDGIDTLRIIDAARRSNATGESVDLLARA